RLMRAASGQVAFGRGFSAAASRALFYDLEPKEPKKPVGNIQPEIGPAAGQEFVQERLVNLGVFRNPVDAQASVLGRPPNVVRQAHPFLVIVLSHGRPIFWGYSSSKPGQGTFEAGFWHIAHIPP